MKNKCYDVYSIIIWIITEKNTYTNVHKYSSSQPNKENTSLSTLLTSPAYKKFSSF